MRSWQLWCPRPGSIYWVTMGSRLQSRARDRGRTVPAKPVEASTAANGDSSAGPGSSPCADGRAAESHSPVTKNPPTITQIPHIQLKSLGSQENA